MVVASDRSNLAGLEPQRWAGVAEQVLAAEGVSGPGELSLTFVAEAEMAELNGAHMGEDGPTDVLSFPLDAEPDPAEPSAPRLLGDVVVCPAVAARQAAERGAPLAEELALLVVHGVLHVLGWDHADAEEAQAMRARESSHLARVAMR
ncbi:MAG: rRNA maturation RNase YbeY [Acidimicrobiales bacterium]